MGREWYWGSGAKTSKKPSQKLVSTTPACITAVFHFFDFHHFHQNSTSSSGCTCFKPESFLSPHPPTILKGVEAPRNSLESEKEDSCSASASASASTAKEEENLNIPMGIQIKTRSRVGVAQNNDSCSENSSFPGTKTPTLVARLMGLDLLPEPRSPSFSSATPNFHSSYTPRQSLQSKPTGHPKSLDGEIRGSRSLPETPRISSARRSDVDHHHRLSLQINKENMSPSEEMVISRLASLKRKEVKHEDENRSAGQLARRIVRQMKESVGRKVGMDITNTVGNREELVNNQVKYKKIISRKVAQDTTHSSSPRLRFMDSKNKPLITSSTNDYNAQPSPKPELNVQPQPKLEGEQEQKPAAGKCKKEFGSRLRKPQQTSDIIRNKQEEPFVRPSTAAASRVNNIPDKKCRKTPLSNDTLNTTVPTLVSVRKDPTPPPTKIPQKQVLNAQRTNCSSQLSSCSSLRYNKQEATNVHAAQQHNSGDRCNNAKNSTGDIEGAEYEYIARILRRTGLNKDTPVSFTSRFSPSHPLDPSIFYYLEHFTNYSTTIFSNNNKDKSRQLNHRSNRKLLFHLVDEILIQILKPYFNLKPWVVTVGHDFGSRRHMYGSQLIDILCSKIKSFPQADCRVLEDIDALIDKDLAEMKVQSLTAYEEEGEGIVTEIEKDILESLVHETALDFRSTV